MYIFVFLILYISRVANTTNKSLHILLNNAASAADLTPWLS